MKTRPVRFQLTGDPAVNPFEREGDVFIVPAHVAAICPTGWVGDGERGFDTVRIELVGGAAYQVRGTPGEVLERLGL